jgi:hypothetical protein
LRVEADDLSVRLYARIEDASFIGPDEGGSFLLEFDRRSTGLPHALTSASQELMEALPEAHVLRVEEDDLATMADTADSAFLQAFNDALEIRRLTQKLGGPQRKAVAEALPAELVTA